MKVVKFKGGLGNQMFQYAFLKRLQYENPQETIKADFSYFEGRKNDAIRKPRLLEMSVQLQFATKEDLQQIFLFKHEGDPLSLKYKLGIMAEGILNRRYFFEKNRAYRKIDSLLEYSYYDGYWQSWRHLEEIAFSLKKEFVSKNVLSELSQNAIERFGKRNSVFVGVRRGDYIENQKVLAHYGKFELDYYRKAMKSVCKRIEHPVFVFFSNDINWVKENMTKETLDVNDCEIEYRDEENIYNDFEELFVMSSCRNAIITNSTFNFWGAWLIQDPNKIIIAPKKWFKDGKPIDIIPDNWEKL